MANSLEKIPLSPADGNEDDGVELFDSSQEKILAERENYAKKAREREEKEHTLRKERLSELDQLSEEDAFWAEMYRWNLAHPFPISDQELAERDTTHGDNSRKTTISNKPSKEVGGKEKNKDPDDDDALLSHLKETGK